MKYEKYNVRVSDFYTRFEFNSDGPRGLVAKIVLINQYGENSNIHNLGFGDKLDDGSFDDIAITNNNDRDKVLATVAYTVGIFLEHYPSRSVVLAGSTEVRVRLYRMAISKNLEELEEKFNVFGLVDDRWCPFKRNHRYEAFLVEKIK